MFNVTMDRAKLARAEEQGLHKVFKLQTVLNTTNMVLHLNHICIFFSQTRMHSSIMRTARSSSSPLGGGGGLPQCMLGYTPWAWTPPPLGVGLETSRPDPPNIPPGSGPRQSPPPPWTDRQV